MDGSHPSGAAGRERSRRDWGRWSSHTAEEQPGRVALVDYKLEELCHEKSRGFYLHLLLKRKGRALLFRLPVCIINTFSGR